METRRLMRSDTEKMIAGVCGGVAEYLDLDPTLVRLAFVLLTIAGLQGVWIYLALLLLMPPKSRYTRPANPVEVVDAPAAQN